MKSSFSGSLILLLLFMTPGLTSLVFKQYNYFQQYLTWYEAQTFCRDLRGDLATIYTQSDVGSMNPQTYEAWVSLRNFADGWHWFWKEGPLYAGGDWAADEPDTNADCGAVSRHNKKFYGKQCTDQLFFFCENEHQNVYTLHLEAKTWPDAWFYCKNNSLRLAQFSSSDLENHVNDQDFPVWIGLHRDGGSLKWSSSFSNYQVWKVGEPSNYGNCGSITSLTKMMATQNCDARFPFICMWENVLLVKENKSWEEALEHCRNLSSPVNSSLRFDLLSMNPGDEHHYVIQKVMGADTEEVWTGLRFLADDWLWVNGADVLYTNLPHCPIPSQHCGALSKKDTGSVEARDCLERKNFLCYTFVS